MIWFFTPYSFEGKLFDAYDQYISLIREPDDWVVLTDGDTLFFQSDFGHIIKRNIDLFPDTGMFTCYTNRIGTSHQQYNRKLYNVDSIRHLRYVSRFIEEANKDKLSIINHQVSGFFWVIKVDTWMKIRDEIKCIVKDNNILHIDYAISSCVLKNNLVIRRMDSLFMLHYYRFVEKNYSNRNLY